MRVRNLYTKEYKTVPIFTTPYEIDCLKFETRKYKGKMVVMRVWYNGWFPLNPVEGLDIRAKQERPKNRTKILAVNYKG